MWISAGVTIFAAAFLIVGILRVVEITSLDIRISTKKALAVFHILGCALFSAALVTAGTDLFPVDRTTTAALLFSGIGILLPLHIFVGVKRKIAQIGPEKKKRK